MSTLTDFSWLDLVKLPSEQGGGEFQCLQPISGSASGAVDITPITAELSGIKVAVEELEGELITIEGILAGWATAYGIQNVALNIQLAAFQAELTAMVLALGGIATAGWGNEAIDAVTQGIASMVDYIQNIEDTIVKALLFQDKGESERNSSILERALLFKDVGQNADAIEGILRRGLIRKYIEGDPPVESIKGILEVLDQKLEELQYNNEELDLGPIRIWLRSRIIEY